MTVAGVLAMAQHNRSNTECHAKDSGESKRAMK
jgi:hypothetical protein